jgi:hypothetical protein
MIDDEYGDSSSEPNERSKSPLLVEIWSRGTIQVCLRTGTEESKDQQSSVADQWHFDVDPDPDPRIHAYY